MTVFLSELKSRNSLRWTGPLFLIPILFLASLVLETWLQKVGIIAYIPVGERSPLSLWRMAMVCVGVNTALSVVFMSSRWNGIQTTPSLFSKIAGALTASFGYCFLTIITASAIALPPLGVPVFSMTGQLLSGALVASLWSTATALLCSVISRTGGGAVLSLGFFALALFPGLSGNGMSSWFVAPLGELVVSGMSTSTVLPMIAHSFVYLVLGSAMLSRLSG